MRPVEKGAAPRKYSGYRDALGDLEDRLGTYCSYCEQELSSGLEVEHVVPKSLCPALELDWDNFLLGCRNCNSVKGAKNTTRGGYAWPDKDNTLLMLQYSKGGFVDVASGLCITDKIKANSLVKLVGLDRHPGRQGVSEPTMRDRRWLKRRDAWEEAEKARKSYESLGRQKAALDLVLAAAKHSGFFSIWFQVFGAHQQVKDALIEQFPGTATNCFDANHNPIKRP